MGKRGKDTDSKMVMAVREIELVRWVRLLVMGNDTKTGKDIKMGNGSKRGKDI